MINRDLQINLEFLALFFSIPDDDFYKRVYQGDTPAGEINSDSSENEFCESMAVETTDLFVNSKDKNTIHPLKTTFISSDDEKREVLESLTSEYDNLGLKVQAFPPDHLKVMYEFMLHRLNNADLSGILNFYNRHIKNWTETMSGCIIERKPSLFFVRIAELMRTVNRHLERLVH